MSNDNQVYASVGCIVAFVGVLVFGVILGYSQIPLFGWIGMFALLVVFACCYEGAKIVAEKEQKQHEEERQNWLEMQKHRATLRHKARTRRRQKQETPPDLPPPAPPITDEEWRKHWSIKE